MDDLRREVKPVFLNGSTEILTYADHLVKESKYVQPSNKNKQSVYMTETYFFFLLDQARDC